MTTTKNTPATRATFAALKGVESAIDTLAACTDGELAYAVHAHQTDILRSFDPDFLPRWVTLCKQVLDETLAEVLDRLRSEGKW